LLEPASPGRTLCCCGVQDQYTRHRRSCFGHADRLSPGSANVRADADPALPSVIQKFWDSGAARAGNLKLLLCGSMIAHMEELLAERNPLYGRKTLVLDLGPLSFREAAQFVRYRAEDRLLTCGVFGGTPFYLELLDGSETLQSNIVRLLLTQTGSLVDEPVVLLQSELREVSRYASILAAIADGCTKHGDIIGRVKEISDSKALGPYLEKLERMRLIRIVRSMDAGPKERDRRYFIADPLIAFWYRFVWPNLSSIAQGFGGDVWRHQIAPRLGEFMGDAFEEICREHARRFSQEKFSAPAQEVGRIWHADFDIDVAGKLLDGSMIYGECKWWKDPVGEKLPRPTDRAGLPLRIWPGQPQASVHFVFSNRVYDCTSETCNFAAGNRLCRCFGF
jgi:AAA+ ATPase superfamily predicted ATPase